MTLRLAWGSAALLIWAAATRRVSGLVVIVLLLVVHILYAIRLGRRSKWGDPVCADHGGARGASGGGRRAGGRRARGCRRGDQPVPRHHRRNTQPQLTRPASVVGHAGVVVDQVVDLNLVDVVDGPTEPQADQRHHRPPRCTPR